jgi:hypothetical protein
MVEAFKFLKKLYSSFPAWHALSALSGRHCGSGGAGMKGKVRAGIVEAVVLANEVGNCWCCLASWLEVIF